MQSDDESDDDAFKSSKDGGSRFIPVKDSLLFDDTGKMQLILMGSNTLYRMMLLLKADVEMSKFLSMNKFDESLLDVV